MIYDKSENGVTLTLAWPEVRALSRIISKANKKGFWRSVFKMMLEDIPVKAAPSESTRRDSAAKDAAKQGEEKHD